MLTTVHPALDVRIFHKEARSLAAAGYKVSIVGPNAADECRDGVRIVALRQRDGRMGRMVLSPIELLNKAISLKADVYHFHDPELIPVGLLLRMIGRRVIYDIHEYTQDDIAQKQWVPAAARPALSRAVGWLERRAVNWMSGVVVVNEHMAGQIRVLVRQPARVVPVHNYPEHHPTAADCAPPEREPVAAYVGVLSKDRGWETLLEGSLRLTSRRPEFRVSVVGRLEPSGVAEAYRTEAWCRFGVNHEGTIPHTAVQERLRRVRVGLIPWLSHPNNERGTPQKLFEYMTAGVPVVASDLSFIGKIVRSTGCGILVPPGDPVALADAIEHLLDSPLEARDMGERGRVAVATQYSWAPESRRLLSLYEAITQ